MKRERTLGEKRCFMTVMCFGNDGDLHRIFRNPSIKLEVESKRQTVKSPKVVIHVRALRVLASRRGALGVYGMAP